MTQTALYARTAATEPAANSVAVQLAHLRAFAHANGWQVSTTLTFVDDGESGATLERPGLSALRAAVAAGRVTCLLALDAGRLSRSVTDYFRLEREFANAGCAVIYAPALVLSM
jgi:site-specific DNA recombinase